MKIQSSDPADDPSGRNSTVAEEGTHSPCFLKKERAIKNLNMLKTGKQALNYSITHTACSKLRSVVRILMTAVTQPALKTDNWLVSKR